MFKFNYFNVIIRVFLIAGISFAMGSARAADPQNILTPRGAPITVLADFPAGDGPFPTVILGPGTGTLKQKINEKVSAALKEAGFAVYRFEWAYYVKDKNGSPSDTERAPEIEDFSTVVGLAKKDKRVDAKNIIVGGKSRGTIIAWLILRNDPSLKGILQLTPVCTKDGFTPEQLYPDLGLEKRPSLWLSGDVDPACNTKTLYQFLAQAGGPARAEILRGDHGLAIDAISALAAALSTDFAGAVVGH